MSATIRRQAHGIRAVTQAITLPGNDMARLKREAGEQGITVSRHVVNLIRVAWDQEDIHAGETRTALDRVAV